MAVKKWFAVKDIVVATGKGFPQFKKGEEVKGLPKEALERLKKAKLVKGTTPNKKAKEPKETK